MCPTKKEERWVWRNYSPESGEGGRWHCKSNLRQLPVFCIQHPPLRHGKCDKRTCEIGNRPSAHTWANWWLPRSHQEKVITIVYMILQIGLIIILPVVLLAIDVSYPKIERIGMTISKNKSITSGVYEWVVKNKKEFITSVGNLPCSIVGRILLTSCLKSVFFPTSTDWLVCILWFMGIEISSSADSGK